MVTTIRYAQVLRQIINTPLLCHPRAAVTFYNALCGRFGTAPLEMIDTDHAEVVDQTQMHVGRSAVPSLSRFEGEFVRGEEGKFPAVEPFKMTRDGVGIVSIVGELSNRGAWVGNNSGIVSYEGIKFQMARAARHPKVKSIIMDIESPGGQGIGAFETAGFVRAINKEKPVFAVVNSMAASAGYALASGARRIITGPSGVSGSIGVVMMHMDYSKALADKGMKPTFIFAGAHKVDGNPFEPLTDSVEGELQAEVNAFYEMFVGTVADGRGRRLSRKAARETEARTYLGQAAVDVGLADAVGSFDEVLSEAGTMARRSSSAAKPGSVNMALIDNGDGTISLADHSAAVSKATADGHDKGFTAGKAEGERDGKAAGRVEANTRLLSILTNPKAVGREAFAAELACKSIDMSAEDVISLVEKVPAAQARPGLAERVNATGVGEVASGVVGPGTTGNQGSAQVDSGGLTTEQRQAERLAAAKRTNEGRGMGKNTA